MPTKPTKRKEPTAVQLKKWLKNHGHKADVVNVLGMSTKKDKQVAITSLHEPKEKAKE